MLALEIPGVGELRLTHLILDINGTLTTDGQLLLGVRERLAELGTVLAVELLSADTRGTAAELACVLGVSCQRVARGHEAEDKRDRVLACGAEHVVAIGNGNNDALMLSEARLGIAVVGEEGAAVRALLAADVVVSDINVALDLLRQPVRLLSTLRY